MAKFIQGQDVVQIVAAPIAGKVLKFAFDENTGDRTVLVGYTDADGSEQQRYFKEDEITAA